MSAPTRSKWRAALLDPAYAAAMALVIIQVGIGVVYKMAARGGKNKASYAFSPSASVTISESLKFLLSTAFFYRECRRRATSSPKYTVAESGSPERLSLDEEKDDYSDRDVEAADESSRLNGSGEKMIANIAVQGHRYSSKFRDFVGLVKNEVPSEAKYGYIKLAMLYSFLNNTIYVSYKLADPGTIQLLKSGVTLVTAMVMFCTLGTKLTKLQWVAISFQLCGLVTTQYHPESGSTYSFSTYMLLISQTVVSACAGVYNQSLNKSQNASLHVDNMMLYAAGASINLMVHIITRIFKENEPGFFVGYDSWNAIMVVLSNVFIGLAITAVYKYANAIIKCFATAVATGFLLYLSPILFGTELSFLTLPGTFLVFTSTWLYMEATPPRDPNNEQTSQKTEAPGPVILGRLSSLLSPKFLGQKITTSIWTALTILSITYLCISSAQLPDLRDPTPPEPEQTGPYRNSTITSPFNNTLAFIRFNNPSLEHRIPYLQNYSPFFHTTHISIPSQKNTNDKDKPHKPAATTPLFNNLTRDNHDDYFTIYKAVADSMAQILNAPHNSNTSKIEGLLFFHFDAWIDPLAFASENYANIWLVDAGNPKLTCMTATDAYPEWWGWSPGFQNPVKKAARKLAQLNLGYKVDPEEFCVGWSDIYYIPRRFFADWILLSEVLNSEHAFHEMAIPTMMHIIENTRRPNRWLRTTDHIGDCWGDCCTEGAPREAVLFERCGHKLDYRMEEVVKAHFGRVRQQAKLLGSEVRRFRPGMEWGVGMGIGEGEEGDGEGWDGPPAAVEGGGKNAAVGNGTATTGMVDKQTAESRPVSRPGGMKAKLQTMLDSLKHEEEGDEDDEDGEVSRQGKMIDDLRPQDEVA